ncbi:NADPH2:quinone reductase [Angomonas deanei]|uniref:Zinc-binding dehydrogenase, putative n=1 Tax=Angomonas deanei TaxID=59799 RepID=A0A7G2CTM8_9TRYP|nr:NADPH2:quinone reductase [Angomonas deanei]CAD2222649.1 Zinc-binding dehydrogenase, putative [Angomonas deanei]|eukprot:EPY26065.1 NADPH2:quinone reductase [Angomonas deanei]
MFHSDATKAYGGTLCEYTLVDVDAVVRIPVKRGIPTVNLQNAAAMPCSVWTIYIALFDKLRIEKDRCIFIDGVTNIQGRSAVQLAHNMGLFVLATCPDDDMENVELLGADVVFDLHSHSSVATEVLQITNGFGTDYYLAVSPDANVAAYMDVVRFGGSLCLTSGQLAPTTESLLERQLSVHYVSLDSLYSNALTRRHLRFIGEQVLDLYRKSAFTIDSVAMPFDKAGEALNNVAAGESVYRSIVIAITK